ncbi:Glycosyl transferase [Pseudobythopirellula maris]|uniref:Lipid-A-disaccharide synthase n=1 Tax=Pseudobythopirellula maris TaxID=2527991 RepID=A0A5C5ZIN6_9BACT|nr:lipid-A-disaccharide synthase [Pseudobythopirellula maris]TWT86867.1 Glycosyl transferase [Pseudobythopirellula maris]
MTIFFSVGEPSGDLHGANLVRELRERRPNVRCVGYGGPRMAAEGCELHEDLTRFAVMWLLQVLLNLPKFIGLKRRAERYFAENRPDAVVLIDYPGFNWHIARAAKRQGVPVFYYGAPQLWGWASWRVKKMRRDVDHALCKLPFEEAWFRERGCNATHVGHPYFDELRGRELDDEFVAEHQGAAGPLVTILPGSRTQEVKANLPKQLEAAERVLEQVPTTRFAIASFKEKQAEMAHEALAACPAALAERTTVHVGRTPELIEAATCCLAVSGSVSLELLYHAKPTVVVYHVSRFAFAVQKWFRRVRYITLVNLLTADDLFADSKEPVGVYDAADPRDAHVLMPEYLTCEDRTELIAGHLVGWLTDDASRRALVDQMAALRERVGHGGASLRAAEYLLGHLEPGAADASNPAAGEAA